MAARAPFDTALYTSPPVVISRRAGGSSSGKEDAFTGVFAPCIPARGSTRPLRDLMLQPRRGLTFSVTADDFWGRQEHRNVLHTLYVAHGGGPDAYVMPSKEGIGSFVRIHEECSQKKQALLIHINELIPLVLVPAKLYQGEHAPEPMFWAWIMAPSIPSWSGNLLGNNQMALILDLDHTLVESHAMDTLEERKKQCGHERQELRMRIAKDGLSKEEREDVRRSIAYILMEEEKLQDDINLLREFSNSTKDVVHVDGVKYFARPETAYTDDGSEMQRPVIRLPDGSILTRIDPLEPKTSTLVRARPGWSVLREYLLERNRYDIYVCSHAHREYTLEAWRLLDFDSAIIPREQRRQRIINVPRDQPKTLLGVLGASMGSEAALHGENSPASAQFPLAVVVDDKKEAWEESSQPHVLQVTPFMYHRNEAACIIQGNTTVAESDKEMDRASKTIKFLRSAVYECIKERVRPEMDRIADRGLQMHGQTNVSSLLPRLLSVPELLQSFARAEVRGTGSSEDVATAGAPTTQVSAEGVAAASLQQDPRRRQDPQVVPSTASTASPAEATQTGPSTGAQGSSSAEQGLAIQQGLDSIAQGNVVKDVLACVMELTQANPLFLQVVNTITQVMLAKPECRHIACFVVEACLRRPSCLPRAAECLIRQPECGLVLLFWELQVEEHAAKMAALAAAEASAAQLASSQAEVEKLREQSKAQAEALAAAEAAAQSAAAQLACSQAEVEKLKELSAAQAEALQAAAVAAGQLRQACQQEMDGMQRTRKEYEEQVEQLKAGASSSAAQALAAEQQKYAQLEREMARATTQQTEELSAAKHKVEELQAQLATQQDSDARVAKDLMECARKLQAGSGSSSKKAQSRKRHREDKEASGANQKEAVTAFATEDKGERGTKPRNSQLSSRKTPSSISPTYS